MNRIVIITLSILLLTGTNTFSQVEFNDVYLKQLDNWQRSMNRWKLRNFVPLVGLHLLEEGENTFGKSLNNDIVINSPHAPEYMGTIIKEGKNVRYIAPEKLKVTLSGKEIHEIDYTFDTDRNSERLRNKFIYWYLQFVGDDYFLRVIDDQSPLVNSYEPFEYFDGNPDMIFEGKYKPFKKPKVIALDNVIATQQDYHFTGEISIKYDGKKYKLLILEERFLMFTDKTNGEETFPYGRYLRLNIEGDNPVIVDFNYAFNPPRSVSLYTTCEIPPDHNHLPFSITAGEKYESTGREIIRPVH